MPVYHRTDPRREIRHYRWFGGDRTHEGTGGATSSFSRTDRGRRKTDPHDASSELPMGPRLRGATWHLQPGSKRGARDVLQYESYARNGNSGRMESRGFKTLS